MSLHSLTRVRRIADVYGVTLPAPLVDLLDLDLGPAHPPTGREYAERLLAATTDRSRAAILDEHARASAAYALRPDLARIREVRAWNTFLEHAAEIRASFRAAMRDDLERLADLVERIPPTTPPTGLAPVDALTAREQADVIASRLTAAATALRPLYGVADRITNGTFYARHALISLPAELDRDTARLIRAALGGSRPGMVAGTPDFVPALWYACAASHGVTFDFVEPQTYRENLARLDAAERGPSIGEEDARTSAILY